MNKTKKIVLQALLVTLVYIGVLIQIPLPFGGMLHLGNLIAILISLLYSPLVGGFSASLGMGLYNISFGFPIYIIIRTLIVKFIMGYVSSQIYRGSTSKSRLLLSITVGVILNIVLEFICNVAIDMLVNSISFSMSIGKNSVLSITSLINGLITIFLAYFIYSKLVNVLRRF